MLGLRLVKLTVNFDDPGAYHLYYGDGIGHPGTILTFFSWPQALRGRRGTGMVTTTAFAVPRGAMAYWTKRLADHGVPNHGPLQRLGEQAITFSDPDGLELELIATEGVSDERAYEAGPVPLEYAIHGFHSATMMVEGHQRTSALLCDLLGFEMVAEERNRFRYSAAGGSVGAIIDLVCAPEERPARVAVGSVHHIAWRTSDMDKQRAWRQGLARAGYNVTPVIDRKYFHSIYFREPGNVLFEIATDPPGFTVDETPEELGSRLQLPPWLEESRSAIQAALPPVTLPAATHRASP